MRIVTCEGGRRCQFPPYLRALIALVYLPAATSWSGSLRCSGYPSRAVADPRGEILWLLPTLAGRAHDLTVARTHRILRVCERRGIPVLAGMAHIGAGDRVTIAKHRTPGGDLTPSSRPRTGPCPRPVHPSNAVWHD